MPHFHIGKHKVHADDSLEAARIYCRQFKKSVGDKVTVTDDMGFKDKFMLELLPVADLTNPESGFEGDEDDRLHI